MKENKLRVDLQFDFDSNLPELDVDLNYDLVPEKKKVTKITEVKIEKTGRRKVMDSSTKLF